MLQPSHWHTLETADQVAEAACEHILKSASAAIAEHGKFKLALAGGTTPEKVYSLLAKTDADWANWIIYYGDERCLPADHPERNSSIAQKTLLDHVPIPAEQIFTIAGELGNEAAAAQYAPIVAAALPLDMVMLGMGEDGHTASLFPGQVHDLEAMTHAVYDAPKAPPLRVSVSAKALSTGKEVLFLITGSNKKAIVEAWRAGVDMPIATVIPENPAHVYIDSAAFKA
jgi:6-phosphogluconolactonase